MSVVAHLKSGSVREFVWFFPKKFEGFGTALSLNAVMDVPYPRPPGREFRSLAETQIYRDYARAFTRATGLPLRLRSAIEAGDTLMRSENASPLCSLMARTNVSCQACLETQKKLEQEARLEPKTLKCFAGLCETAVPVRVGENLIAWLETGQILLDHPTRSKFDRLAKTLLGWGSHIDLKHAEEAYFNTRVISRSQYESAVRLLQIFASHLAQLGQQMALQSQASEPTAIAKAREWIATHSEDSVSLASAAQAVNLSAKHFSDVFRKATGIPFVEYVARVRVEKAKTRLSNPQLRVSEIAFEVGFQSLSQFNRAFKKFAGQSPKSYRRMLPA